MLKLCYALIVVVSLVCDCTVYVCKPIHQFYHCANVSHQICILYMYNYMEPLFKLNNIV